MGRELRLPNPIRRWVIKVVCANARPVVDLALSIRSARFG